MAATVGYSFPANSWPTYHWPGIYEFPFGEIWDGTVIMNLAILGAVMMAMAVNGDVTVSKTVSDNTVMNLEVNSGVILNKEINQPDYSELEDI
jgi:hypothetical protein